MNLLIFKSKHFFYLSLFLYINIFLSLTGCAPQYHFDTHSIIYASSFVNKEEGNGKRVFILVEDDSNDEFYTEFFWCNPYTKFVPPVLMISGIKNNQGGKKVEYQGDYKKDFLNFITLYFVSSGFSVVNDRVSADHVVSIVTKRHCSYLSGYDYIPSGLDAKLLYAYNSVFHAVVDIDGRKYEYYNEAIQKNTYVQNVSLIPLPFGNKQSNEFAHNVEVYMDSKKIASAHFNFANDGGAVMAVPFVGEYIINSYGQLDLNDVYKWSYDKNDYVVNWGHISDIYLNKQIDDRMLWVTESTGPLNLLYRDFARIIINNM